MGLRPAKCYRSLKDRAYTRTAVKVHRRNYIGATPGLRVRQFNMGNGMAEFSHVVELIAQDDIIVRDNAIESARMTVTKKLTDQYKKEGFFLKIRVYPHHILRENKLAQGAGADRVSTGMSHSFGKAIGRGARVKKGKILMSVLINESGTDFVKKVLKKAGSRFPCDVSVKIHTDTARIGTRPKKLKLSKSEKTALKEEEETQAEKTEADKKGKSAEGKDAGKKGKPTDKKDNKKEEKKK